jgi:hypothetical protein
MPPSYSVMILEASNQSANVQRRKLKNFRLQEWANTDHIDTPPESWQIKGLRVFLGTHTCQEPKMASVLSLTKDSTFPRVVHCWALLGRVSVNALSQKLFPHCTLARILFSGIRLRQSRIPQDSMELFRSRVSKVTLGVRSWKFYTWQWFSQSPNYFKVEAIAFQMRKRQQLSSGFLLRLCWQGLMNGFWWPERFTIFSKEDWLTSLISDSMDIYSYERDISSTLTLTSNVLESNKNRNVLISCLLFERTTRSSCQGLYCSKCKSEQIRSYAYRISKSLHGLSLGN